MTGASSYTADHLSAYRRKKRRHPPDRAGGGDDHCQFMCACVCVSLSPERVHTCVASRPGVAFDDDEFAATKKKNKKTTAGNYSLQHVIDLTSRPAAPSAREVCANVRLARPVCVSVRRVQIVPLVRGSVTGLLLQ